MVAIDLDGTLVDFFPALRAELAAMGCVADPSVYHLGCGATVPEACRRLAERGWPGVRLMDGALDVVMHLFLDGREVALVSSRPQELWTPTYAWLERHKLPCRVGNSGGWAELHLIGDEDKLAYCRWLIKEAVKAGRRPGPLVLIDDRGSTVLRAVEERLPAILFDQPHNSGVPVPRALRWRGEESVEAMLAAMRR